MLRAIVFRRPLKLTANTAAINDLITRRCTPSISNSSSKRFLCDKTERPDSPSSRPLTEDPELTRVDSLVKGCDYKHWLVIMDPPEGYPSRDQIVQYFVRTLALALGSEADAKRSMYSVSTKYYYAFSCKIPENMTHKIKFLPRVRWILPDSYMLPAENDYGGEPFVNGEVVPHNDKYHKDWLVRENTNTSSKIAWKARKPAGKRTTNSEETSG